MSEESVLYTSPAKVILSTGKEITQKEWEEVRERVHQQDDEEDIRFIVNSGVVNDLLPFECVPEECIREIAARKSAIQKESCSWYFAARHALLEWCDKEKSSIRELFSSSALGPQEESEPIQPLP